MTADEVIKILASFEKRLGTIADQAHETCEQAQHVLARVIRLQDDVVKLRLDVLSNADTAQHKPLTVSRP